MVRQRDQDIRFLKTLINNINANLHVAQLARVYKLTDDHSRADVQPLALDASGKKRAPLINVPVGMVAQGYISEGSVVLVMFLDRSMENWSKADNQEFSLANKRMHDVNDAVICEVMWSAGH
ncbi:ABC transporter substrate-binding protein [Limosilactobacillus sp. STM2_1]|uniref:ABC transporter substrate-binding protein n=1 Tax=Limosilactobacillus rudii TaxID=2759755 RepID=A0A7W3YM71_9LACO|nr:ABC transporter substrate-binding protein [Limosilactobacillus rudii]MBB1078973.1 ABC transporter substrate-binding protein [Limosilactobacillus rudii]MBB1097154.1 ABC transporter substrate-binding protein [Limosilactobacillus rudii]MCD7134147.1 ABC transporter substrate-binding protein [Limosilactobacillus rudii]